MSVGIPSTEFYYAWHKITSISETGWNLEPEPLCCRVCTWTNVSLSNRILRNYKGLKKSLGACSKPSLRPTLGLPLPSAHLRDQLAPPCSLVPREQARALVFTSLCCSTSPNPIKPGLNFLSYLLSISPDYRVQEPGSVSQAQPFRHQQISEK